jgi:hypothetical protein
MGMSRAGMAVTPRVWVGDAVSGKKEAKWNWKRKYFLFL